MKLKKKNTFYNHIGSEIDIQLHLVDNLTEISINSNWGNIRKVEQQFCFKGSENKIFCDVMVWHTDGTGTLIEVKKYKDETNIISAIGQVLMYGEYAKLHLDYYPRLIIAADFIPPVVKSVIMSHNLQIGLLQLDGHIAEYFLRGMADNVKYAEITQTTWQ